MITAGDQAAEIAPTLTPVNAQILSYAPALQVLQNAELVVCQAGANLVNEAVWYGVRMLLLPGRADQPGNAARVVHHKLGVALRRMPSSRQLGEQIDRLLRDETVTTELAEMQMAFHRRDRDDLPLLQALETLKSTTTAMQNASSSKSQNVIDVLCGRTSMAIHRMAGHQRYLRPPHEVAAWILESLLSASASVPSDTTPRSQCVRVSFCNQFSIMSPLTVCSIPRSSGSNPYIPVINRHLEQWGVEILGPVRDLDAIRGLLRPGVKFLQRLHL